MYVGAKVVVFPHMKSTDSKMTTAMGNSVFLFLTFIIVFCVVDLTFCKRHGADDGDSGRSRHSSCDVQQHLSDINDSLAVLPEIMSILSRMDEELADLKEQVQNQGNLASQSMGQSEEDIEDCSGVSETGQYAITPPVTGETFPVVCDMDTKPGGWIVIQRRFDGSVSFDRTFDEYENGFGSLDGEFWLGLKKLNILTNSTKQWEFRVDLEDFEGNQGYAVYDQFKVGDAASFYPLDIGSYIDGDAGDSIKRQYRSGIPFTTKDQDNDDSKTNNCGISSRSGWWHKACTFANVNGLYLGPHVVSPGGIYWVDWKQFHMLKGTELKIRPVTDNQAR